MTIDLTLDGLKLPDINGYVPPFGTKITRSDLNKGGLSTREVSEDVLMPFSLMRPKTVEEDSVTTAVEYDAKLVFAQQLTEGVTLTMGDAAYEGCEITVSNLSGFPCVLSRETWSFSVPSGLSTKVYWKSGRWQARLDDEKPVGFLYESFDPTDPGTLFGGTWVRLPDGVFIRNAGGDAGAVGQTQAEGLPNITGRDRISWSGEHNGAINNANAHEGCFTDDLYTVGEGRAWGNAGKSGGAPGYGGVQVGIAFDASAANPIYGSSSHVTPYNMAVYMWRRTA